MATIRTALGDVRAEPGLGAEMVHEHVLFHIVSLARPEAVDAKTPATARSQVDCRSNECPANARQTDRGARAGSNENEKQASAGEPAAIGTGR